MVGRQLAWSINVLLGLVQPLVAHCMINDAYRTHEHNRLLHSKLRYTLTPLAARQHRTGGVPRAVITATGRVQIHPEGGGSLARLQRHIEYGEHGRTALIHVTHLANDNNGRILANTT